MPRKVQFDGSHSTDSASTLVGATDAAEDALLRRLPLTSVLEAMPDAVLVYDTSAHLIFANAVAHRQYRFESDPVFGERRPRRRAWRLDMRTPDGELIPEEQGLASRLLNGETIPSDRPAEVLVTGLDGSECALSVTGAPVTAEDGALLGAIVLARDVTEQRRQQQAAHMETESVERELARVQTALDTALMRLSLDEMLHELLERARDALKTDTATLLLLDERDNALRARAASGLSEDVIRSVRVPVGKGFAGRIALTREPLYLEDTSRVETVSAYLREQLRSVLGVPLLLDDRLLGVLHVGTAIQRTFSQSDIWLLQQIAERAALAIDRAQLYEALQQAHTEAAAQASMLDAMIERLSEGVVLYGPDRATLHANSAFRRMLGIPPDVDPRNRAFQERGRLIAPRNAEGQLLPEEDWPALRMLRGEVIEGEASPDIWLRSYDGHDALYSVTGGPVYDSAGAYVGAVMALRDVTAHRQLEREASSRATTLEAVIETVVDGLFVLDAVGHMVRVNRSGRRHVGLGDDASLAEVERALRAAFEQRAGKRAPTEPWPITRVLRGEALAGAQAVEAPVRLPDGRERLLNISGAPMRGAEGAPQGAVLVTRDITDLHALEHRTQQALDALLEMAETIVSIPTQAATPDDMDARGDEAPDRPSLPARRVGERLIELTRRVLGCQRMGISVMDHATGVMHALAVAGLTPEQERMWWAEQEAAEARGVRLEDSPEQAFVQRLFAGEAVMVDLRDPRYAHVPNTYDIKTALFVPMLIAHQLIGIISLDYGPQAHVFTDEELHLASAVSKLAALVIERDRLLRERAAAEAHALALAQANQRMDEFLGIAAHELRTPITVIKANLQMLARYSNRLAERARMGEPVAIDAPRATRNAELLDRTERSLSRLTRLVDDLLDVSRVRAGKLEMRIEPMELGAVTRDAVEEQRLAAPDRRITLDLPAEQSTFVLADESRVGQVITNYLTNALKYSGATTSAQVRVWRDDTMAYVSVADQGVGIPADELEQVWDLFHRIPGIEVISGSGIGLGLGLHLCKTIIERQGGQVGVTSQPGVGSTFWFSLPLLTQAP